MASCFKIRWGRKKFHYKLVKQEMNHIQEFIKVDGHGEKNYIMINQGNRKFPHKVTRFWKFNSRASIAKGAYTHHRVCLR